VPLLLVADALAWRSSEGRAELQNQARVDLILVVFIALFLAGHSLFAFEVWDRYLLGLVPLLALLLARVLTLPWRWFGDLPHLRVFGLLFVLFMLSFTFRPIRDAAASRFPIGGDHGAYQGIEQVVNYFRAVPAETTLYHRWLGWHWRFYLWGSAFDYPAWTSPADLAAQAAARPGARRYIVFPSWRSATEARLALADAGLAMREVARAFRDDGSVSFVVYRIETAP
jgi:energy-coupling factor transporter transmembrane protein EcfT